MPQINVSGIVLRCYDLGEKDQIVVLLTAESGKMRVVAKGAKRPGGRFAAAASPFTEISASVSLGRNLHTLNQVQIVSSHRHLRERLDRMAVALFITELVDHATVDAPGQSEFLALLALGLGALEGTEQPELTLCFWLLQLLELSGLAPAFTYCASCQSEGRPLVALSARSGGLVCGRCTDAGSYRLPPTAVQLLGHLAARSWEDYEQSGAVPLPVLITLCRALEQFVFYQLEARPRSYEFLISLRPEFD